MRFFEKLKLSLGLGKGIFTKDARHQSGDYVRVMFRGDIGFMGARSNDRNYLELKEKAMDTLVSRYWDSSLIKYHKNSKEFPDCDDFAAIAFGGILRGSIKEGLKYAPLFGSITLKHKKKGWHRQNWAIVRGNGKKGESKLRLFEPQSGKWTDDLTTIQEIREVSL